MSPRRPVVPFWPAHAWLSVGVALVLSLLAGAWERAARGWRALVRRLPPWRPH